MFKAIKRAKSQRNSCWQLQKLVSETVCMMMATVGSVLQTMPWSINANVESHIFQLPYIYLQKHCFVPSIVHTVLGNGLPFLVNASAYIWRLNKNYHAI